jgi:YVTN family beta-propeller protein
MKKLVLLVLLSMLVACGQGRDVSRPEIQSVTPSEGQVKSPITVQGKNFIDTYSQTFVRFNGEKAQRLDFSSVTDTEIQLLVPNRGTTGPLDVQVSDKTSHSVPFTVYGPWGYVVSGAGQVAAVDSYNDNLRATFDVGFKPDVIAVTPEGDKAYMINRSEPLLVVVNAPINQVITTIPLDANPVDVALSTRAQHYGFISHGTSGNITVIDTISDTVIGPLVCGPDPGPMAVDFANRESLRLMVALRGDNTVEAFALDTLLVDGISAPMSGTPEKIYMSPDAENVVTLNTAAGTASLLKAKQAQLRAELTMPGQPINGDFTIDSNFFYVVSDGSNIIYSINIPNKSIQTSFEAGSEPYDVTVRPDGKYAYISNRGDGTVTVVSTSGSGIFAINVGGEPRDIGSALGPNTKNELDKVLVLDAANGVVTLIDAYLNTVLYSVPVGADPQFMEVENLTTYPPNEKDIVQR